MMQQTEKEEVDDYIIKTIKQRNGKVMVSFHKNITEETAISLVEDQFAASHKPYATILEHAESGEILWADFRDKHQ